LVNIEIKPIHETKTKDGELFRTKYFEVFFKDIETSEIKKKMEKQRDSRKDWPTFLYEEIIKRMKYERTADKFDIEKLEYEETVIAMAQKFKEHISFNETPKQKALKDFPKKK